MSRSKGGSGKKLEHPPSGGEGSAIPGDKPLSDNFNITLPRPYEKSLRGRMARKGVSFSEAIRQCIDEAESRHPSAVEEIKAQARAIVAASLALRRMLRAEGATAGFLDTIEKSAERVGQLAGA